MLKKTCNHKLIRPKVEYNSKRRIANSPAKHVCQAIVENTFSIFNILAYKCNCSNIRCQRARANRCYKTQKECRQYWQMATT